MKCIQVAMIVISLLCVIKEASPRDEVEFRRAEEPELREISYLAKDGQCQIEWTIKKFGDGKSFGFSERSKCDLPVAEQGRYRRVLLRHLIAETDNLRGVRNFYWGRLLRGDASSQYSDRLARMAEQSALWNRKSGALADPAKGVNDFVMRLLNDGKAFGEVDETFAEFGFSLKVNGIEKVIIRAFETGEGGLSQGKYPVDCLVTFSVLKK